MVSGAAGPESHQDTERVSGFSGTFQEWWVPARGLSLWTPTAPVRPLLARAPPAGAVQKEYGAREG